MAIQTLLPYDVNARNADSKTADTLGQSLEGLVNRHVQKMQQKQDIERNTQGYQEAWKLSPQQAAFVANQSPEFQQDFVKALHAQQQAEAFDRAIHPERYPSQPSAQPSFQPNSRPSLEETMGNMGTQPPQDAIAMALQKGLQQAQIGQPSNIQKPSAVPGGPPQPAAQAPTSQGKSIADVLANRPLNPNLQAKAEELNLKRESNAIKQRESSYKLNKKEIREIHERGDLARKNISALQQVKKYNATGKLIQGQHRAALEAVGLEDFYTNEPTQVVDKILQGLRVGIGKAYGTSRITNLLAQSYDKTLPRMINTKEGMDAVIDNKILDERGEELTQQSLRNLEKKYQKADLPYPTDIIEQARENVRPQLDKLGEEGIRNIDNFIKRDNAKIVKQLPPAADNKGKSKIHAGRGVRATSDGKEWIITPL